MSRLAAVIGNVYVGYQVSLRLPLTSFFESELFLRRCD